MWPNKSRSKGKSWTTWHSLMCKFLLVYTRALQQIHHELHTWGVLYLSSFFLTYTYFLICYIQLTLFQQDNLLYTKKKNGPGFLMLCICSFVISLCVTFPSDKQSYNQHGFLHGGIRNDTLIMHIFATSTLCVVEKKKQTSKEVQNNFHFL